ncbi:MAG: phosphate signaling complex PhoU family protein [Candidatus Thorarchaeota archaeon]
MSPSLKSVNSEIIVHLKKLHELVTASLSQSIRVFEDLDIEGAEQNMETAQVIESLHHTIEDMAFGAIAGFCPKDIDLRRLVAYIHTSTGLHRVGRYAYKIMEIVTLSDGLDHFKDLVTLPYLAELATTALNVSIRAVLEEDLSEIDELEKLEAQSDNEATDMFQEIAIYLNNRKDIANIAMLYVIVGRYFERAADQAIIIAESAVFLVSGERKKLGFAYKGVDDISDIVIDI